MTTKSKSSMLSSLVEWDLGLRTSVAKNSICLKPNFISRSLERLLKLRASVTFNRTHLETKFNVEYVGATMMTSRILWLSHANVRVLSVSSISNVWEIGFWLKNKRSHQVPRTLMYDLGIGRNSSVKFASKCIHTPSRSKTVFTRTCNSLMISRRRPRVTIFCSSPCLWTKITREISICLQSLLSNQNSS